MQFSPSVEAEEDIVSIAEQGVRAFGFLVAQRYRDEIFTVLELIALRGWPQISNLQPVV
ncbi:MULTISPECIES: type II toxin-antitoxin system RelE/ParE family toxin [unclassified Rhizobium]|uniref:type II toxin-antitoxin system RelE/ParE family toxin n=1 Tax=unclassified Rhizobium TaxID=2613769 RepID=UPI000A543B0F